MNTYLVLHRYRYKEWKWKKNSIFCWSFVFIFKLNSTRRKLHSTKILISFNFEKKNISWNSIEFHLFEIGENRNIKKTSDIIIFIWRCSARTDKLGNFQKLFKVNIFPLFWIRCEIPSEFYLVLLIKFDSLFFFLFASYSSLWCLFICDASEFEMLNTFEQNRHWKETVKKMHRIICWMI